MTMQNKKLMITVGRCLRSALDNFETRATPDNINALTDIECDLQSALTAVKALIVAEYKATVSRERSRHPYLGD